MKKQSIIFSGEEVRATLEGQKTQMREIIKPQPSREMKSMVKEQDCKGHWWFSDIPDQEEDFSLSEFEKWNHVYPLCPYKVGDRLWVRETWARLSCPEIDANYGKDIIYKAEHSSFKNAKWRSPVTIPRWASRIDLEITDIRVERVQDISWKNAKAEGAIYKNNGYYDHSHAMAAWTMITENLGNPNKCLSTPIFAFANYWNSLHSKDAWDRNDWVWVREFRRIENVTKKTAS